MSKGTPSSGRRKIGLLIGAAIGLVYSLVSININYIVIRDLPLYFNFWANFNQVVWAVLAGAVMGYVVNWPDAAFLGIFLASLLGGLTILAGTLIAAVETEAFGLFIITSLYIIFPLIAFFVPLSALLRWITGYILRASDRTWWKWYSMRLYLGLAAAAIIFGSFSLYSREARLALHRMNDYIRQVQTSGNDKSPWAFKTVGDVVESASHEYNLEWTDDLQRFPYSFQGDENQSGTYLQMVFARFTSGEELACLFKTDASLYLCAQIK